MRRASGGTSQPAISRRARALIAVELRAGSKARQRRNSPLQPTGLGDGAFAQPSCRQQRCLAASLPQAPHRPMTPMPRGLPPAGAGVLISGTRHVVGRLRTPPGRPPCRRSPRCRRPVGRDAPRSEASAAPARSRDRSDHSVAPDHGMLNGEGLLPQRQIVRHRSASYRLRTSQVSRAQQHPMPRSRREAE